MRRRLRSRLAFRLRAALGVLPRGPVFLGDHTALLTTVWGGMLLVDTRESLLAPPLLLNGLWEPEVTEWLQSTLRPGEVFVDIGANIGYFSLLAAQLVGPSGRVVAVEAHPRMAELLRRNMVVNGFGGVVTTWHRAAWSREESLKFHLRSHFAANSSTGSMSEESLRDLGDTEQVIEVPAVAVDDLLVDVPRVDVIKVDVEGAELRVFSGLERTLAANPSIRIMFEWSPGQLRMLDDDPQALVDLLAGHGLRFRLLEKRLARIDPSQLLEMAYANVLASR